MFQRFVTGDSAALCEIVAFAVAAAIFITISWCALRMKRPQVEHFANLPFATETPAGLRPSPGEAGSHRVVASVERAETGQQP